MCVFSVYFNNRAKGYAVAYPLFCITCKNVSYEVEPLDGVQIVVNVAFVGGDGFGDGILVAEPRIAFLIKLVVKDNHLFPVKVGGAFADFVVGVDGIDLEVSVPINLARSFEFHISRGLGVKVRESLGVPRFRVVHRLAVTRLCRALLGQSGDSEGVSPVVVMDGDDDFAVVVVGIDALRVTTDASSDGVSDVVVNERARADLAVPQTQDPAHTDLRLILLAILDVRKVALVVGVHLVTNPLIVVVGGGGLGSPAFLLTILHVLLVGIVLLVVLVGEDAETSVLVVNLFHRRRD